MTISDLVTQSCVEINAGSAGQPVQPEVFALGLQYLNMILDHFNATDRKLVADLFSVYTIPANTNPISLGPTGTWVYANTRPADVRAASIILTSTPSPRPYVALTKLTTQQWQGLTTPTLASSLANYYYYNPTTPNGAFYFWTVESEALQVQLLTRQNLAQVTAGTTFAQAPSYWYALMMLLARKLKSPLRKPWTPEQERELTEACVAAFGNNAPDLLMATADAGMPQAGQANTTIQDFNFYTGALVP